MTVPDLRLDNSDTLLHGTVLLLLTLLLLLLISPLDTLITRSLPSALPPPPPLAAADVDPAPDPADTGSGAGVLVFVLLLMWRTTEALKTKEVMGLARVSSSSSADSVPGKDSSRKGDSTSMDLAARVLSPDTMLSMSPECSCRTTWDRRSVSSRRWRCCGKEVSLLPLALALVLTLKVLFVDDWTLAFLLLLLL